MFVVGETSKCPHAVNLNKVLLFYPIKSGACTRFEMEDGTLLDFIIPYDELIEQLAEAGLSLPL